MSKLITTVVQFSFVLGMAMYNNRFETQKDKIYPWIKLNCNIYIMQNELSSQTFSFHFISFCSSAHSHVSPQVT